MPSIFEKNPDVVIEKKSDSKIVLYNTVTNNKTSRDDKTDIAIILAFNENKPIIVDQLARKLNVDENRILKTLKDLVKRGFISNTSEDYFSSPDEE